MSAAALQPSDFAFGIPLSLDEDGAVYRLTVPRDVYAGVVEGDLGDLRVFNGVEAVVPHIRRRPEAQADLSETATVLPMFPLFGSGNEGETFSVRIEKEKGNAVINIDSEGEGDDEKRCLGYILDLGAGTIRMDAIDLQWPEDAEDFMATVSVAYSEDLTNWSPLVSHATVANMAFGGHRIIRRRIELGTGGLIVPVRRGNLTSRSRVKAGASTVFF
jgi:hypothetical protein